MRSTDVLRHITSEHFAPIVVLELWLQPRVLEVASVHQRRKRNCPSLFLCPPCGHCLALDFRHLPCWQLFELVPLFVNCGLCTRYFQRLVHKNRTVHKIAMTKRIEPLFSNVIFMISLPNLFNVLSGGFAGFNDACVSCFPCVEV